VTIQAFGIAKRKLFDEFHRFPNGVSPVTLPVPFDFPHFRLNSLAARMEIGDDCRNVSLAESAKFR